MTGLLIATWDMLCGLLVVALALGMVGLLWRGALAVYPLLVTLAHDALFWLVWGVALALVVACKPGGYKHGA